MNLYQFKQLMIKLDPDEEAEDDEAAQKTPQKAPMPNTSQAVATNDVTINHMHMNNVQINLTRVNLVEDSPPPQNFVSLKSFQ